LTPPPTIATTTPTETASTTEPPPPSPPPPPPPATAIEPVAAPGPAPTSIPSCGIAVREFLTPQVVAPGLPPVTVLVASTSGFVFVRDAPATAVRISRNGVLLVSNGAVGVNGFSNFLLPPPSPLQPGTVFSAEVVGDSGTATCSVVA